MSGMEDSADSDEDMLHEEEASSVGEAASEDGEESGDGVKSGQGGGGDGEASAPPAPAGKRGGRGAAAENKKVDRDRVQADLQRFRLGRNGAALAARQ